MDPICSLKMWDWIKIMVCRRKYHVGTLLKNSELKTNFRSVADLGGGGAQPARAPPFETFFYKCPPPLFVHVPPPPFWNLKKKKEKKVSDSARLYPGCYLPPPWRRWRSGKKVSESPPPAYQLFWDLRGWRRSEKNSMLCPPFSNSWIRRCFRLT